MFKFKFISDLLTSLKYARSHFPPTAIVLKWAFFQFVETIQKTNFSEEILKLQKSIVLPSNIHSLTPFVHTSTFFEGDKSLPLIRVGGRLLNADLKYNTKFPLLLQKRKSFVALYLRNLHLANCHAGTKALIALSRENIGLINAKEECKRLVSKCLHCFRYKPKLMSKIMGNLLRDHF